MVIAAEPDEEVMEKRIHYREGVDQEAAAWRGEQGAADKTSTTSTIHQLADQASAMSLNMGPLVGSYESVGAYWMKWRPFPVRAAYCSSLMILSKASKNSACGTSRL
jgi:hypothetical protein